MQPAAQVLHVERSPQLERVARVGHPSLVSEKLREALRRGTLLWSGSGQRVGPRASTRTTSTPSTTTTRTIAARAENGTASTNAARSRSASSTRGGGGRNHAHRPAGAAVSTTASALFASSSPSSTIASSISTTIASSTSTTSCSTTSASTSSSSSAALLHTLPYFVVGAFSSPSIIASVGVVRILHALAPVRIGVLGARVIRPHQLVDGVAAKQPAETS